MSDSYSDFFFLQTTDFTLFGPLFTETKTTQAKVRGQSPAKANLVQRVRPLSHFFFTFLT